MIPSIVETPPLAHAAVDHFIATDDGQALKKLALHLKNLNKNDDTNAVLERCLLAMPDTESSLRRENEKHTLFQAYAIRKFLGALTPKEVDGLSAVCARMPREKFKEELALLKGQYQFNNALFAAVVHNRLAALSLNPSAPIAQFRNAALAMNERIRRWAVAAKCHTELGFTPWFTRRVVQFSSEDQRLHQAYKQLFWGLGDDKDGEKEYKEEQKAFILEMCRAMHQGELRMGEGKSIYTQMLLRLAYGGISLTSKLDPKDANSPSLFVAHLLRSKASDMYIAPREAFLSRYHFNALCKSLTEEQFIAEIEYLKTSPAWADWFVHNEKDLRSCIVDLQEKQDDVSTRAKNSRTALRFCSCPELLDASEPTVIYSKRNPNRDTKIGYLQALLNAGLISTGQMKEDADQSGASCSYEVTAKRQRRK